MSIADPSVIAYRLDQNAKAIDRLTVWRTDTDKEITKAAGELRELRDDIGEIGKSLASVRRLMVTLLVSITSGTVLLSISLMAATGRLG